MPAELLRYLVRRYQHLTGEPFPQDPRLQLRQAIEAVFRSWNGPRAVAYRTREHISHDSGTAVNVQAMVFGNRDDNSGTGVGFTRDPATGAQGSYGDFLVNAQGEDVVAGIRKTLPLAALEDRFPDVYRELHDIFARLERHYRDMLDTEFTIEQGKLWMLQTRVGKRTGRAALRMAVDMTADPDIRLTRTEAVLRVQARQRRPGAAPRVRRRRSQRPDHRSRRLAGRGSRAGLLRVRRRGRRGGTRRTGRPGAHRDLTRRRRGHAAVRGRGHEPGWSREPRRRRGPRVGDPGRRGGGRHRDRAPPASSPDDVTVREGDWISVDGTTGEVMLGQLPLTAPEPPAELALICEWADDVRRGRLGVRANADSGTDAALARKNGAEGVGLCRTEHMFLGDRLPLVQRMILADTPEKEASALAELLELQRSDFEEIFAAMDGLPVTVRLLDPPLHEFLPDIEELIARDAVGELDKAGLELFTAARSWQEQNPMLGTRGVRLGILRPNLYKTQVRAVVEAAERRVEAGGRPIVEIMVPLIVTRAELALVRRWIEEEIEAVRSRSPVVDRCADRHDDRDAAGRAPRRRHRRGRRLLLVRHERSHPDDVRLQP